MRCLFLAHLFNRRELGKTTFWSLYLHWKHIWSPQPFSAAMPDMACCLFENYNHSDSETVTYSQGELQGILTVSKGTRART